MAVCSHLIGHRWLGSVASMIEALIHLDQKRFRFSVPLCRPFVPGMMFGRRRGLVLAVLICLSLTLPLVALSQEVDEGEFALSMSNSFVKRSITSSVLTTLKRHPSNGAKLKSNNSLCAIISLTFASSY
jgi:hypothetical protein